MRVSVYNWRVLDSGFHRFDELQKKNKNNDWLLCQPCYRYARNYAYTEKFRLHGMLFLIHKCTWTEYRFN